MGSLKTLSVKGEIKKKKGSGCENAQKFCTSLASPFLLHIFRYYSLKKKISKWKHTWVFNNFNPNSRFWCALIHWHLTSSHHKCLCTLFQSTIEYGIILTKVSSCKTGFIYIIQKETAHKKHIQHTLQAKSTQDTNISREHTLTVKVYAMYQRTDSHTASVTAACHDVLLQKLSFKHFFFFFFFKHQSHITLIPSSSCKLVLHMLLQKNARHLAWAPGLSSEKAYKE